MGNSCPDEDSEQRESELSLLSGTVSNVYLFEVDIDFYGNL